MRRRIARCPAAVRVPQLVGCSVRAAQDLVLDVGLFPVQCLPDRGVAGRGVVVRQSPAAGRVVARSTRVMIWVDSGPSDPDGRGEEGGGRRVPLPPGPRVPSGAK